jgi:hypothetical protein
MGEGGACACACADVRGFVREFGYSVRVSRARVC